MKKADLLLFSDIHCGVNNIQEFRKNWMEAFDVCKKNGIKDIVIGGDIFTAQASQTLPVLLAVKEMFVTGSKNGLHFDVASGNHDRPNKENPESYCHLYDTIENVNVVDEYALFDYESYVFGVISYFPENGSFKNRLDRLISECDNLGYDLKKTILYIHEGVKGALGGLELDTECDVEWFKDFAHVLCGHYHNRIKLKGTNVEYIGSSRQANFGEDELKGYTIVFDDGSYEFVQNESNLRYRTVKADFGDDLSIDNDPRYKTRLQLNCTDAEGKTVNKDKLIEMGYNKVELKTERIKSVETKDANIEQRYDKIGIKREYKSFCNTKEIEPELGLKYLDKID